MILSGTSTVKSGTSRAGITVCETGKLFITSADGDGKTTGTLNVYGGENGSGMGSGDLSVNNQDGMVSNGPITIHGGTVIAKGGNKRAGIGSGRTTGKSSQGGRNITINGGYVDATGGDGAAGIGGGVGYNTQSATIFGGKGENITIHGGTVIARGGISGAGIGGGSKGSGGKTTISGGIVTATAKLGAGIGGGEGGKGGTVIISSGTVSATSSYSGAGIGGGYQGEGGTTTISGGTVITTGGNYAAGIGGGNEGRSSTQTMAPGTTNISPAVGRTISVKTGNTSMDAVAPVNGSPFTNPATFSYSGAATVNHRYAKIETTGKLNTPQNLAWGTGANAGKATWNAVTNASSYSVQLYKGDTAEGSAVSVTGTEHDFTSAITETGSYTFTVTAIGNGASYTDSDPATSKAYSYAAPTTTYTVTLSASPTSGGTVSGGGTFGAGSRTVTATANANYTFVHWTENGSTVSTSASYTFTLLADRTLVAVFDDTGTNPPASSNSISGITSGQIYTLGNTVAFTATGGGMNHASPRTGDRRWLPTAWATNPSGNFNSGYTQSFSTAGMTIGAHTLTVTFTQQQYNGTAWENTGTTDQKSVAFTIQSAAPTNPTITDPKQDKMMTLVVGNTAAMSVTADNATGYQWYVDRNDGNGFVAISGATGATYMINAVTVAHNGYQYRCIVSNANGSTTSPVFTHSVKNPSDVPATGDNTLPGLWIGVMMLACAGLAGIIIKAKKSKETSQIMRK